MEWNVHSTRVGLKLSFVLDGCIQVELELELGLGLGLGLACLIQAK